MQNQAGKLFRVFMAVKPMLASKMTTNQLTQMIKDADGCIVETKFDGERIQCHI